MAGGRRAIYPRPGVGETGAAHPPYTLAHTLQVNATSLIHLYYTAWSTDLALYGSATPEHYYYSLYTRRRNNEKDQVSTNPS